MTDTDVQTAPMKPVNAVEKLKNQGSTHVAPTTTCPTAHTDFFSKLTTFNIILGLFRSVNVCLCMSLCVSYEY